MIVCLPFSQPFTIPACVRKSACRSPVRLFASVCGSCRQKSAQSGANFRPQGRAVSAPVLKERAAGCAAAPACAGSRRAVFQWAPARYAGRAAEVLPPGSEFFCGGPPRITAGPWHAARRITARRGCPAAPADRDGSSRCGCAPQACVLLPFHPSCTARFMYRRSVSNIFPGSTGFVI